MIKSKLAAAAAGSQSYDHILSSHVTMTFAALVTLLTLGDDLSRVNRTGVLQGVQSLQNEDGRYVRIYKYYQMNFNILTIPNLVSKRVKVVQRVICDLCIRQLQYVTSWMTFPTLIFLVF